MKAMRLHKIGEFTLDEVEKPVPKGKEILMKIGACGICGSGLPRVYELGTRVYPVTLGHEFAGTVEAVGEDADPALVGKRAAVFPCIPCRTCENCETGNYAECTNYQYLGSRNDGGFAEYCLIPSDWHLVLSSNPDVPLENLSLVEPATVAQHALRRGTLAAGEKIVIIGAGPIGIMEARWAEIFGAGKIALLEIDDVKIEFARARNLTVYDVKDPNCIAQVLRDFGRVDVVIEGTGTGSGCNTAIQLCRAFGRIVLMGNPHRDTTLTLDNHSLILRKELNVLGMWNSHYAPLPFNEWDYTVAKIDSGELAVADLITHRASLAGLKALFDGIHDRSITICKAIYSADEMD